MANAEYFDVFGSSSSSSDNDDEHYCRLTTGTSQVSLDAIAAAAQRRNRPVLWEVLDSKNGGKGLFATGNIALGCEIHREGALIRCPNAHAAESQTQAIALHKKCIHEKCAAMSETQHTAFMELYCLAKYANNDLQYGIYQTNSVRLTGRDFEDGGVFCVMCRMNHSCRPNVRHEWNQDLEKLILWAIRDIEQGEELYCSYVVEGLTTRERREYLMTNFDFYCKCSKCTECDTVGEAMSDNLEEIIEHDG